MARAKPLLSSLSSLGFALAMLCVTPAWALSDSDKRARLDDRAAEFWDAVRDFDLYTAYQLERGTKESTLSANAFRRHWANNKWELREYRITGVEIEGDEATLSLDMTYHVPNFPRPLHRSATDYWLFMEGDWFHNGAAYREPEPQS